MSLYPNQDLLTQSLWTKFFTPLTPEQMHDDRVILGPWNGGTVVEHTFPILGYDDDSILAWLNECAMRLLFKIGGQRIDVPFRDAADVFRSEVEIAKLGTSALVVPITVMSTIPALGVDTSILGGLDVVIDSFSSKSRDNWVLNACHTKSIHFSFSPIQIINGRLFVSLKIYLDKEQPLAIRFLRLSSLKGKTQNPYELKYPIDISNSQPYIFGMETDDLLSRRSFYTGDIFFDEHGAEVTDGQ